MPSTDPSSSRTIRVSEPGRTPALSLALGSAAMAPFMLGAACTWLLPKPARVVARDATMVWGGAILAFLAGVRRGLSFRTEGGATESQIGTMLWLYLLGLAALAAPRKPVAPAALMLGYATLAVLDPEAARDGEAPLFFARLRPVQMLVPLASLLAIVARRPARS